MKEKENAEKAAVALQRAFGDTSTAYAMLLNGTWYVVTSGTGEGCSFAYDPEDMDIESLDNPDWNYSEWCSRVMPVEDRDIAVAAYMADNVYLGHTGSCETILTAKECNLLDIAGQVTCNKNMVVPENGLDG